MVNGVLYFTVPDHVWAVDARTGREIWHYQWQTTGGNHLGNRGVAIYEDWLYFETPDCYLISLNVKDGKERWRKQICDIDRFYYASAAPTIVKDHLIVGVSGDDFDIPGYIQSHHPESGECSGASTPCRRRRAIPASETWPNEEMAKHGGGMTWQPITYDPELNYVFVTTGNPQPVIAHKNRAGDNLFTGSIVAVNADTGKMVWHFQSSPHDTHDWDSTQTAVLIDDEVNGQKRKLIAQAARNGHYFLLDRTTGKAHRLRRVREDQLVEGLRRARDSRFPTRTKMPQIAGALVSPNQGGATNWQSPSFSPRPACSTSARRAPSASITSTTRARTRWAGAASIAAAGPSRCSRRSTTRPARSAGRHKWEGNAALRHRQHRRQRAVHRRPVQRSRRARRHDRPGAVARDPERIDQQRPDHLRARRPAVRRRGGRRHAVDVRDEYASEVTVAVTRLQRAARQAAVSQERQETRRTQNRSSPDAPGPPVIHRRSELPGAPSKQPESHELQL